MRITEIVEQEFTLANFAKLTPRGGFVFRGEESRDAADDRASDWHGHMRTEFVRLREKLEAVPEKMLATVTPEELWDA